MPKGKDKGKKVELSLCLIKYHAMKTYPVVSWAPCHKDRLEMTEKNDQLHVLAALLPGKELLVPTGQEAGWVIELVWMQWQREEFPSLPCWG
jgi:hypothetical protein